MATMKKMTSCLWFNTQAEEAAKYYTSIFKNSKMGRVTYFGKEGQEVHGGKEGAVLTVEFELEGQQFLGLNGGPAFKFNEAVSFVINCDTQEEIDYYWEKLGKGGDPNAQQCGWLKDKYGLSWQVAPTIMAELLDGSPNEKSERAMKAMMQMKKMDIKKLKDAYEGK